MDISYISDLHLDFHVPFTKNQNKFKQRTKDFIRKLIKTDISNREVLVISGDISHLNTQTYFCVKEFSKHYQQVFLVIGNHDMYLISKNQANKYKNHSINRIIELENMIQHLSNVYLFNEIPVYEYEGVKFGGATMWYPLETIEQQMFFKNISNDSKLIKGFNIHEAHKENQEKYKLILQENVDVMISHVPPIKMDSHFKYNSTSCYLSPVQDIQVNNWISGHVHEQNVYNKPYGNFYVNSIGYPEEKLDLSIKYFTI